LNSDRPGPYILSAHGVELARPKPAAGARPKAKQTKVFWFFFSKKNRRNKDFFLKKEAKTFICFGFAAGGGRPCRRQSPLCFLIVNEHDGTRRPCIGLTLRGLCGRTLKGWGQPTFVWLKGH
jgi:hypothetical protein